jgi:hypothetical protein
MCQPFFAIREWNEVGKETKIYPPIIILDPNPLPDDESLDWLYLRNQASSLLHVMMP